MNEEREEKARRNEQEAELLCKELRYTQQTVAGELAGWKDMHDRMGRKAIKDLARGMLTAERMRMEGLQRALRRVGQADAGGAPTRSSSVSASADADDVGGRRRLGSWAAAADASGSSPAEGSSSNGSSSDDDDGLFGSEDDLDVIAGADKTEVGRRPPSSI